MPFFSALVALMVVVCAAAWFAARRATTPVESTRERGLRRYAIVSAAVALVPAASFLAGTVPWWRVGHPLAVLFVVTAALAVIGTGIALALERLVWGRAGFGLAAAVGVLTAGVIGVDLLTGAHLQIFTVAGYSPLVAGRFAGIGNVAFGLFAAGALLAAAGVGVLVGARASRRPARWAAVAVAATGAVAVLVDGAPPWGSDVGGVLALVPAVAALAWWIVGARLSWRAVVGVLLAAIGAVAVLGAIAYSRPAAHQTHLGRFVGELLHGGAWTVVRRKALADVHLLTHSPLTLLIPLLVVAGVWVVRRPPAALARSFEREPILRPALGALLVMAIIGAVVNDSGIAIPALAVLVVLPAAMSVVVACAAPTTSDEQPESGERLLR